MDGRLETDLLSGVPYACLSVGVRCFFPDTDPLGQRLKYTFTHNFNYNPMQTIRTGSAKEKLYLPYLFDCINLEDMIDTDEDTMLCLDTSKVMPSVIQEDCNLHKTLRPGYCYLRLNTHEKSPGLTFEKQDLIRLNKKVYIRNDTLARPLFPRMDQIMKELAKEGKFEYQKAPESGHSPAFTFKAGLTDRDLVPCIAVPWPNDAASWQKRNRKYGWPTAEVISNIVSAGCHLVRKPHPLTEENYPNEEYKNIEWRYSFSLAEIAIAESLNPFQRIVYKAVKALMKYPKRLGIQSYLLKTTLFWVCEDTPASSWTLNNLGRQFLFLLDKLLHFLSQNHLPQYFVPEGNLIEHLIIENPKEIQKWIKGLEFVRRQPLKCMEEFHSRYVLYEMYPLPRTTGIILNHATKLEGFRHLRELASYSDITHEESESFMDFVFRVFGSCYGVACLNAMVLTIAKMDAKAVQCSSGHYVHLKEKSFGSFGNDLKVLKNEYRRFIEFVSSENTPDGILGSLEDEEPDQVLAVLKSEIGCICYQMSETDGIGQSKDVLLKEAERYFLDAVCHEGCPCSVLVKYAQYLVVEGRFDEAFPVLQRVVAAEEWPEEEDAAVLVSYDKYTDKGIEATLRIMHSVEEYMYYSSFALAYYLLLVCCLELGRDQGTCAIPDVGDYCQKFKYGRIRTEINLFEACFMLRYGHVEVALYLFMKIQDHHWIAGPYTWFCIAKLCCLYLGK